MMINSANDIQREIKVKEQKLSTVTSFKYFGADNLKNCASHCSSYKRKAHLERKQYISWVKGEADALPCHSHISVCLLIVDLNSRVREKNAGL